MNTPTTQYTPKAIAGQSFLGYTKISKAQVAKLYATGQRFSGFIVGNKVASFHFFGGWHLACTLSEEATESLESFNKSVNEFCFYLDAELGSGPAFYLKK